MLRVDELIIGGSGEVDLGIGASSGGRYILEDTGADEVHNLRIYDTQTQTFSSQLESWLDPNQAQGSLADDGSKAAFYVDNGSSTTIWFTPDSGANLYSKTVTGGDISGSVAANDNGFVYCSNATSVAGDGTNYDVIYRGGYAPIEGTARHIDVDSAGVGGQRGDFEHR